MALLSELNEVTEEDCCGGGEVGMQKFSCIRYFSHCCDKIYDKRQLREGRVCLGSQFEDIQGIHHGKEGMASHM